MTDFTEKSPAVRLFAAHENGNVWLGPAARYLNRNLDVAIRWQFVAAEHERLVAERTATLEARGRVLEEALRLAAVRLEILTSRMRGCHEETGKHALLGEAEMFCQEARAALENRNDD